MNILGNYLALLAIKHSLSMNELSMPLKENLGIIRIVLLKAVIPYVLPKDTSAEEDAESDTITPPAIIVFGDTEEYEAYKELSSA